MSEIPAAFLRAFAGESTLGECDGCGEPVRADEFSLRGWASVGDEPRRVLLHERCFRR